MRKLPILAILLVATSLLSFVKAPPPTTTEIIDFTGFTVAIPCSGETVTFTGNMLVVSTVNVNGKRFMMHHLSNPQNLSGVSTAGENYRAVGNTQHSFSGSLVNGQSSFTYVNNFRMIGQGSAANFRVHETFHVTVNANGTTTTTVENLNVTCE